MWSSNWKQRVSAVSALGGFWHILATFCNIWHFLEFFSNFRWSPALFGEFLHILLFLAFCSYFRHFPTNLAIFGNFWRFLAIFGIFWNFLAIRRPPATSDDFGQLATTSAASFLFPRHRHLWSLPATSPSVMSSRVVRPLHRNASHIHRRQLTSSIWWSRKSTPQPRFLDSCYKVPPIYTCIFLKKTVGCKWNWKIWKRD